MRRNHIVHHFDPILLRIVWLFALAVAPTVHRNDLIVLREVFRDRLPYFGTSCKRMDEEDRLSLARHEISDLHAIGVKKVVSSLGLAGDYCGDYKEQAEEYKNRTSFHEIPPQFL